MYKLLAPTSVGSEVSASFKLFNVTECIPQPPRNIIKYFNTEKFRYDDYLANSMFKLLLSVIVVDMWLSKSEEIFG